VNVWRPEDPIGMGQVYLPDRKSRDAYGKACRDKILESAAQHCITLSTIYDRRAFIDKYPETMRDDLKAKIKKIWEMRK